jgi:5-hydroxyisourate hydrolase-like protein (transthyretin family)
MLRDLWTHVLKLFSGDDGRNKPAPAIATTKKTNVVIAPAAITTDNGGDYAAPKKKRGLYRVKFYTGSYSRRQADANADGAICFVAHHFNAASKQDVIGHDPESGEPIYGFVHNPAPDYALCVVADNASAKSRRGRPTTSSAFRGRWPCANGTPTACASAAWAAGATSRSNTR